MNALDLVVSIPNAPVLVRPLAPRIMRPRPLPPIAPCAQAPLAQPVRMGHDLTDPRYEDDDDEDEYDEDEDDDAEEVKKPGNAATRSLYLRLTWSQPRAP